MERVREVQSANDGGALLPAPWPDTKKSQHTANIVGKKSVHDETRPIANDVYGGRLGEQVAMTVCH